MRYTFKQKAFSWFDSYNIYDESGQIAYVVKGQPSWGHLLKIYDPFGNELGTVKQEIFTWMPQFELYFGNRYVGRIKKRFGLISRIYDVDYNGWEVVGSLMEWDYEIHDRNGRVTANITKELLHFTDTYIIDVSRQEDSLIAVMFTLAIDAEKCSRNND